MKVTDIIIRELSDKEIQERKPFSHFGWEGDGAVSFLIISDGYWESAKILLEYMKVKYYDFAVVDTLIYPLFFNYRHSVETFLKLLFFNYGEQTKEAKRGFLSLGHNLQNLWNQLRPSLKKGVKHVGSSVDLNAVEYYIQAINQFDPDSMIMRYPIKKDLTVNKDKEHHFDFINLGERMDELCKSLRQLNNDLSNQMLATATPEELEKYLNIVNQYRHGIDEFISILDEEASNEHIKFDDILTAIRIPSKTISFLKSCKPDLLILLDNLFYGGQSVNDETIHLSKSQAERQKEFVRLCNELLQKNRLCFGVMPEDGQINIWSKKPSVLLRNISIALSILDLKS